MRESSLQGGAHKAALFHRCEREFARCNAGVGAAGSAVSVSAVSAEGHGAVVREDQGRLKTLAAMHARAAQSLLRHERELEEDARRRHGLRRERERQAEKEAEELVRAAAREEEQRRRQERVATVAEMRERSRRAKEAVRLQNQRGAAEQKEAQREQASRYGGLLRDS